MKFKNESSLISEFEKIEGIRFYPYVGEKFLSEEKRIMVFANLNYCHPDKYDAEQEKTKSHNHYADSLEEFTYQVGSWTKSFRNFIKGSCYLDSDYSKKSSPEIIEKIDNFVDKIAYTNYINDLVKSDKATGVVASKELLHRSNKINEQLLNILGITHCVCWGSMVLDYLLSLSSLEFIERKYSFQSRKNEIFKRQGFSYVEFRYKETGKILHVLTIFHPSMPKFGHFNSETHDIFNWFYNEL